MNRLADQSTSNLRRYLKLVPYSEVERRIEEALHEYSVPTEFISTQDSLNRICAQQVKATRDLPERPLVAMDGYAVNSRDTQRATLSNNVSLLVRGALLPGANYLPRIRNGYTCYTATGAPLPPGTDAVARVEEVRLGADRILLSHPIAEWENVFAKGEDYSKGSLLMEKDQIINSAGVALLISLRKRQVKVYRVPKVAVISIGDELAPFNSSLDKKTANNYSNMVCGFASDLGVRAEPLGVCPDDPKRIAASVKSALAKYDAVITIGGSSVGKKDVTTDSLSSIPGASVIFHGVAIVPIRPAGLLTIKGKPVIILPANAISVATSFFMIAKPVLNVISGLKFGGRSCAIRAKSTESLQNDRTMSALYLVTLERSVGGGCAFKTLAWGSNLISNLARSNGFVQLDRDQKVEKNEELRVNLFGASEMSRIRNAIY